MTGSEIEKLMNLFARMPGLGPRSARRISLFLLEKPLTVLSPLIEALEKLKANIKTCEICGNFDTGAICAICEDLSRHSSELCVVIDVASLWAIERARAFKGRYHVLGGVLSALDNVGPDQLRIASLLRRIREQNIREVIFATPATVDGQTTAHYITDQIEHHLGDLSLVVSGLAHGVPMGGELDYLDDGTIGLAFRARGRI